MSDRAIHVQNLVKRYGDFAAVNDVSFDVNGGQIFGFLGPNGAGKSTTISILTTLGLPTAGTATVGGYDVVHQAGDVRRIAGVALQEIGLDPLMKSRELLIMQARLFGMNRADSRKRADQLIELVGLQDATERRVGKYSGGMRRRLDLALALVHQPEILFLDEPTTGLDPASRRDVWEEVRRLNDRLGMTIFLTTQYLEEADFLAENIAIIDHGEIVAEGAPAALKAQLSSEAINITLHDAAESEQARQALATMAERIQIDRTVVRLYLNGAAEALPRVVNQLQQAAIEPVALTLTQPSLDDVFLAVTGQRFEADPDQTEAAEPAA